MPLSLIILKARLFAWLLLRLKQPQQTIRLVILETQINVGGAHVNSRSAREF